MRTLHRPRLVWAIYELLTAILTAYVLVTGGRWSNTAVIFGLLAGLSWVLIRDGLLAGSFARYRVYISVDRCSE